jgi:glycosyltransferase involved in cell wall biosynthesis
LDDDDHESEKARVKFVLAQIGARRGYAVPAILEKARMLERFYTDISGDIGLGRFLATTAFLPVGGKPARRLAGRRLPENIRAKTTTFPGISVIHALRRMFVRHDPVASFREASRFSDALGHAMVRCGFGDATHFYSMLGECSPLLVEAKRRGLPIVSEVYIPLSTARILAEERKKFPGWEPDVPNFETIQREVGAENVLLEFSDYFICSCESVRDDLVANWDIEIERTVVVPYGVPEHWFQMEPHPICGRVLFAGTADLRKGIHYFAMAAEKLVETGHRYEFRVAGNVAPSVANQKLCRHLAFLGRILREEMTREFAAADVFVLPSLADASAGVTYEALACGVPVITTLETGSVVRDGIEGRIIPSRDPQALADAISEIVEDRQKREGMAAAARERARDFTWHRYGERLIGALRSFAAAEHGLARR